MLNKLNWCKVPEHKLWVWPGDKTLSCQWRWSLGLKIVLWKSDYWTVECKLNTTCILSPRAWLHVWEYIGQLVLGVWHLQLLEQPISSIALLRPTTLLAAVQVRLLPWLRDQFEPRVTIEWMGITPAIARKRKYKSFQRIGFKIGLQPTQADSTSTSPMCSYLLHANVWLEIPGGNVFKFGDIWILSKGCTLLDDIIMLAWND